MGSEQMRARRHPAWSSRSRSANGAWIGATVIWLSTLLLGLPSVAAEQFSLKTIDVVDPPERVTVISDQRLLVVGHTDFDKVSLVDTVLDQVIQVVSTAARPILLEYDSENSRVLVVEPSRVEIFNLSQRQLVWAGEVETPFAWPWRSLFDDARGRLFLVDFFHRGLGVLSGVNLSFEILFDGQCSDGFSIVHSLSLSLDGSQIVIPESGEAIPPGAPCGGEERKPPRVTLLDADSLVDQRHQSSTNVFSAKFNPSKNRVYALIDNLALQHIEVQSGISYPVAVGNWPAAMALDEARDVVYVSDKYGSFVYRVDGANIDANVNASGTPIPLPAAASDLLLDPIGGRLFAVDWYRSQVSVIDTAVDVVTATYAVGFRPRFSALDEVSHKLYLPSTMGRSLTVLSPRAHAALSEVTALPDTVSADGFALSHVTITPRDSLGLELGPGHLIEVTTTAGTLIGSVADHGDGSYSQSLRASHDNETAILTISVDGVEVDARPRVVFRSVNLPTIVVMQPEWALPPGGIPASVIGSGFLTEGNVRAPVSDVFHRVFFGNAEATDVAAVSDTEIQCTVPAHAPGIVDILVIQVIGGRQQSAMLREGFAYVENESLSLTMTGGDQVGEVDLRWAESVSSRVSVERSSSKDFSTDVVTSVSSGTTISEVAPSRPQVLYYRVVR